MASSGPPGPLPSSTTPSTQVIAPATAAPTKAAGSKKATVTKAAGAGTQAKTKRPAAPRRKKPAAKPSSATQAQTILAEGRAAQIDLAQLRAEQAAKRSDPLWYRIEDVLPSVQASESLSKTFPEQIDIIVEKALSTAGLSRSDVTPQAMACLLEHARRYASDLIKDAQDYAHSASRLEITKQDLSLVMEFQDESNSISSQIPKLNLLSQQINRVPLPPIPPQCYSGVLLPPKEHQLTARTFDVVSGARISRRMTQILPINPRTPPKASSNDKPNQSYGAMKGPQIPITLKTNTGVAPMETEATVPSTGHEGGESQSTAAVNAPADSLHPALL